MALLKLLKIAMRKCDKRRHAQQADEQINIPKDKEMISMEDNA
jgi:hypothetical protein